MDSLNDKFTEDNLCSGLLYIHARINDNTKKVLDSASFLFALVELLDEKGFIAIEDLDARKKGVAARLLKKFSESCIGLVYQDPEYDKYTFKQAAEVDCRGKLDTCKAACCRIPFALSRQDVDEGVIRWNFGRPYLIAHDADGYCVHLDRNTYRCSVHEYRPVPCRGFDCSKDKRIWEKFKTSGLNPDVRREDWPQCLSREEYKEINL